MFVRVALVDFFLLYIFHCFFRGLFWRGYAGVPAAGCKNARFSGIFYLFIFFFFFFFFFFF